MDKEENIYVKGAGIMFCSMPWRRTERGRYYEQTQKGERLPIGIGDLEVQRWQLIKYRFMFPTRLCGVLCSPKCTTRERLLRAKCFATY